MHPALTPKSSPKSSPASRPRAPHGQMTAVMRAVAPRHRSVEAPRALRVGMVMGGRIVEERLVRAGGVTIGEGEDATFVVAGVVGTHRLFTEKNGRFTLHPTAPGLRLRGRLGDETGVGELNASTRAIPLGARARGRLTLGLGVGADATLLFQMVEAPAPATRAALPLAVKNSLLDIVDWPLTILVAMSFLLHFGVVGAMYSDWSDGLVDESVVVQGLVDLSRPLPPPVVEDPERAPPQAVAPAPTTATPAPAAPTARAPSDTRAQPQRDPSAGLLEAAERMRIDLLATTSSDSALADALRRSNIPPVILEHADAPVARGSDLTLRPTAPIDPAARRGDLASVVVAARKEATDRVDVRDTPGPRYDVTTNLIPGAIRVPSAERTILALRPAFRRCYELGLQKDASMSGDVTIRARLRPTGEVDAAQVIAQNGLSPEVSACIQRRVATAEFERPEAGGATIDVPVKFVRQR